jgi:hypothetical protein
VSLFSGQIKGSSQGVDYLYAKASGYFANVYTMFCERTICQGRQESDGRNWRPPKNPTRIRYPKFRMSKGDNHVAQIYATSPNLLVLEHWAEFSSVNTVALKGDEKMLSGIQLSKEWN